MDIDELRLQIDTLDRQLVDLLVARSRVTAEIGAFKRERGLALYVPERESELLNARREQAQAAGADPDMVEDVLRRVMRGSYASQETALPAVVDARAPVVVLGGRGAMGRLMVSLFERADYPVRVIDVDNIDDLPNAVVDAGLVMVSVPIDRTTQVIAALPKLPQHCVLCDITSVKQVPLEAMLAALGAALPPTRHPAGIDFAAGELRLRGLDLEQGAREQLGAALAAQGYRLQTDGDRLLVRPRAAP